MAEGEKVHVGPTGLLSHARFTVPLKELNEIMEIGPNVAAVAPVEIVSLTGLDPAERQKSPVAAPVSSTACDGTVPLSWIVRIALRAAGSFWHEGVNVTWIAQLAVMGPLQLSLSEKSGVLVEPLVNWMPVTVRGCPGPTLLTVIVWAVLELPTGSAPKSRLCVDTCA